MLRKRTVYVETVQNKHWQKMPEFTQKIGQRDLNNSCFSCHLLIFSILLRNVKYFTLLLASDCVGSNPTKNA